MTKSTFRRFGSSKEGLWDSLQAQAHQTEGLRDGVGRYMVTEDTPAAIGIARANTQFGSGGGTQLFVNNFSDSLMQIGDKIPL